MTGSRKAASPPTLLAMPNGTRRLLSSRERRRWMFRVLAGALLPMAVLWLATPHGAAAAGGGLSAYVGGLSAYVTSYDDSTISQYSIGASGNLTPKSPETVPTGLQPEGVAVSPDGASVYVANYGNDKSVSQYSVGTSGTLTAKSPATVPCQGFDPAGIAVSPDGTSLYVTTQGSNRLCQYSIGTGGTLTAKTPPTVATGPAPNGVAVSADGTSVYVANQSGSSVSQYSVGTAGMLIPKSPATVPAGDSPIWIGVSPDGTSVYVTNLNSGTISQYSVGTHGRLTPKSPANVPTGIQPSRIAVSPDGMSVYVSNFLDIVSQYTVEAGGTLTAKTPATVPAGYLPGAIAVTPDGASVYVGDDFGHTITQFTVGSAGRLTAKTPATVRIRSPAGVAVRPDQGPVAAFSAPVSGAIGQAVGVDASASKDTDGTVARYDWQFGDGTSALNAGPKPSHRYSTAGTYAITLTVTDNAGCSTKRVFTGQTMSCNGGPAARDSHTVSISSVPVPATGSLRYFGTGSLIALLGLAMLTLIRPRRRPKAEPPPNG